MGDPKKLRKKYSTPKQIWNAKSIELEAVLLKEYGLKNKTELWKMNSFLKKYKDIAKKLISIKNNQGEVERKQMLDKLQTLGLIQSESGLDSVLSLEPKDIMERRLQSLVFRHHLARSMKQARQFIVHRHIFVGDKKITFPSYLVSRVEETQLKYDPHSSLSETDHPERTNLSIGIHEEAEAIRKKKTEPAEENEPKENKKRKSKEKTAPEPEETKVVE